MKIVIDLQGFLSNPIDFIPKELTIYKGKNEVFTYLFKPKLKFKELRVHDKRQVHWLEQNHHCLKYDDSGNYENQLEEKEIGNILRRTISNKDIIYVRGDLKQKFLMRYLNCAIINLEYWNDCPQLSKEYHNCHNHTHNFSFCSKSNAKRLYNFLITNK